MSLAPDPASPAPERGEGVAATRGVRSLRGGPVDGADAIATGSDVERTVAVWHPGMSRATYSRLLRLLFDAPYDDDETTGNAA